MKILLAHNYYQLPGGEDEVLRCEKELLCAAGHETIEYSRTNTDIQQHGIFDGTALSIGAVWNYRSYRELHGLLQRERPSVAHFHNTFPLISPAAYYACARSGVPVIQSLHNPRFMCPSANFYRLGRACDDCAGRSFAWPGILHGCYHHSHVQSAVVAAMAATHKVLRTWHDKVDVYVVFTEFYRKRFISSGLPEKKVFLKPHFVEVDPGERNGLGEYALYLGRLAPEKGTTLLLQAWAALQNIPLKVRGSGPLAAEVEQFAKGIGNVTILPRLSRNECFDLIKGARFLVWPSQGYNETFGRVAIEAFACGVPVLATHNGAMAEIVESGKTGLHFEPGNALDLAEKVRWAWEHPQEMAAMGRRARSEYEAKYTAQRNYEMLIQIYERALERRI